MRKIRIFKIIVIGVVSISFIVSVILSYYPNIIRDIGYITRPVWDSPPEKWIDINNYGVSCKPHGWTDRDKPRKVYDATIFSVELDIFELRLKELWDTVDVFVVVESNTTFVGDYKPLVLKENISRFDWAKEKLHYHQGNHKRLPGESVWDNERHMRDLVEEALIKEGVGKEDLVINSDVDEIPHHDSIDLLRRCDGVPPIVHLSLKNFLYSFKFPQLEESWRASVKLYSHSSKYTHSRQSNYLLAGSGWHCSFCFRNIDDFRFKMKSYSHHDRLTNPRMLETNYITEKVCNGKDIFSMFPEAYNYRDLVYATGKPKHNHDFTRMPKGLNEDSEKFAFLFGRKCEE